MTVSELIDRLEQKGPPAPAEELAAFESELGSALPAGYREFLTATNGGYVEGGLWFHGPTPDVTFPGIDHALGFRPEWHLSLKQHRNCYAGFVPDGLLCVFDDPFQNAICIGLKDSQRGRIYFLDLEAEPNPSDWDGQVETAGNVTLLANSFSEFVSGLKPSEE